MKKYQQKREYKKELKAAIKKNGYWSDPVYKLNTKAIDDLGFVESLKIHDKVKGEIKEES